MTKAGRPKNVIVVRGGTLFSVSPKGLREFCKVTLAGGETTIEQHGAIALGSVYCDLATFSRDQMLAEAGIHLPENPATPVAEQPAPPVPVAA